MIKKPNKEEQTEKLHIFLKYPPTNRTNHTKATLVKQSSPANCEAAFVSLPFTVYSLPSLFAIFL